MWDEVLANYGLRILGVSRLPDKDAALHLDAPHVALIGAVGAQYWPYFAASPEFDVPQNSLDLWSKNAIAKVAKQFDMRAVFPSDGPSYYPFQQWALSSGQYSRSPVGVLIHHEWGLWTAFRGALCGDFGAYPPAQSIPTPCDTCAKPCLSACPVAAFSDAGYNVAACKSYLHTSPNAPCHQRSCMARVACPVAPQHAYDTAPSRFHMSAFLG